MGRIGLAFRIFFRTLFSAPVADSVRQLLKSGTLPKITTATGGDTTGDRETAIKASTAIPSKRSEALTLLAALQREARLVDLVRQPLEQFSDEQIGAVARNVLKDSGAVLDRFFAIQAVLAQEEGEQVEVAAGYDPARFKLSGNVGGSPPYRGRLMHAGWEATALNLPVWTGSKGASNVIAPAEVEV